MVEDRVQDLDSSTYGIFQLYFYDNLFNPEENSKIQDKTRLNKKTIETLVNEMFALDNQDKILNNFVIHLFQKNILHH